MPVIIIIALFLSACGNRFDIPADINANAKVEGTVKVEPITGEVVVKHLIQIELPTVLSDDCKNKYPDNKVAYNACVSEYIKYLISIINQIPPAGL